MCGFQHKKGENLLRFLFSNPPTIVVLNNLLA